jgi:outer membrane protein assembly factor BamB
MDGHVLWSHALKGRDISDWKVSGATFVYAGADYRDMAHPFLTRAAIDLQAREPLWFHVIDDPQRFVGGRADEWIIALPEGLVLFGDDGMHTESTGEVVAYELRTGRRKWILRKDYRFNSEIYRTWVATRGRLFVQVADYQEGRLAQAYDQATGSKTEHWHVFGKARIGNSSFPWALRGDGLLVGAYREFAGANAEYPMKVYVDTSWLGEPSLTWKTLVHEGGRDRTGTVGLVGVSEDQAVPILVTLEPNRYLLLNPSTGAVEQEGRLPGSRTWNHRKSVVDRQAALYAYPYLLVGASRALDQREEAYDLIALNLTTGTVDWSFELDSDPDEYSDLTSFAVNGPNVYVSCKNGRILAFRTQAPLLQH